MPRHRLVSLPNEREHTVLAHYKADGWVGLHNGAPDFLMLKVSEAGEIIDVMFVEVKSPSDELRYEQAIWKAVLERAGIKYKLEVVP